MKILQLADTHFGTEQTRVCAALTHLARTQAPELLLVCGDITQRARPRQFTGARAFIDALDVRYSLIVPGNHDIPLYHLPLRLIAPRRRFSAAFGPFAEGAHQTTDARVVALDTTRRLRHVDGSLDERQVEHVARAFDDCPSNQWRLVVVHQPIAVPRHGERHNVLHGAAHAVRRWAVAGVDLVLVGHIHLPYVLPLGAVWPNLPRAMWAVQAGTASSTRVRAGAPNSCNLLTLCADDAGRRGVVERYDYDTGRDCFDVVARHALNSP